MGLDRNEIDDALDPLALSQLSQRVEIAAARRKNFDQQFGKRGRRPVRIALTAIDPKIGTPDLALASFNASLAGQGTTSTAADLFPQFASEVHDDIVADVPDARHHFQGTPIDEFVAVGLLFLSGEEILDGPATMNRLGHDLIR